MAWRHPHHSSDPPQHRRLGCGPPLRSPSAPAPIGGGGDARCAPRPCSSSRHLSRLSGQLKKPRK
jgi:hypothetical protein